MTKDLKEAIAIVWRKILSVKSEKVLSVNEDIDLFFLVGESVATLTWPSVGVKPNTWKSWGFGVLRDSRMFRARQQGEKHPRSRVFLVSLERSWNLDIENGLALAIRTCAAQVMGKRRAGSQIGSLTPDH
jgi:hypothetical protein